MVSDTRRVNRQSTLPQQIEYTKSDKLQYFYDDSGNITKILNGSGRQIQYTYDSADRLIREDNQEIGKSYFYTYDNNGNIIQKKTCAYTTEEYTTGTVINYTYDKDKLLSYNGESCVYDSIGNPTIYRGKSATWKGRQLQSFNGVTFSYDGRGRRITKKGIKYYYDYKDRLISGNGLEYYYDHIGVAGFKYGGEYYTYKRDIQNNVIAILDSNGTAVVQYKYDAWGNHIVNGTKATTIGALNPFRYRSYFYDIETGLYYLQTRYYDPEVGRFINMDSVTYADPEATNGLNLYVYCGNNPVMNVDPTGEGFFAILGIALLLGLVSGGIKATVTAAKGGSSQECLATFTSTFIQSTVIGASAMLGGAWVVGGLSVTFGNIIGTVGVLTLGTFGGGIASYYADTAIRGGKGELSSALKNGALTFTQGLLNFGLGAALGAAGLYDWLKPENNFFSTLNAGKDFFIMETGKFGLKGAYYGVLNYLGKNIGGMFINSMIREFFIFPWNLIKP